MGEHGTERIEIAREFVNPDPVDEPLPWNTEFHGEPDLTQPPPGCNGHAMRWITRTVTYGAWRPVEAEPKPVHDGTTWTTVEGVAYPDDGIDRYSEESLMPDHLFSLGGGETAWDDPADVYEHEIATHDDLRARIVIERWTAATAHRYLPRVDDTIERAVEYGADEMGVDGAADAWSDAGKTPEVIAAFRAALDLLASHVNYSMCGEKVGEHVLTYDDAGEPLLDGEPMYRTREATDA